MDHLKLVLFISVMMPVCFLPSPQDSPEKLERPHRHILFGPEGGGGMSADSPVQTPRGRAAALLFAEPQTVKRYRRASRTLEMFHRLFFFTRGFSAYFLQITRRRNASRLETSRLTQEWR